VLLRGGRRIWRLQRGKGEREKGEEKPDLFGCGALMLSLWYKYCSNSRLTGAVLVGGLGLTQRGVLHQHTRLH